jgi:hypothetical protein
MRGGKKRCPPIDPGWGVDHIGGTLGGLVVWADCRCPRFGSPDRVKRSGLEYSRFGSTRRKGREKSGDIQEIPLPIAVEISDWIL